VSQKPLHNDFFTVELHLQHVVLKYKPIQNNQLSTLAWLYQTSPESSAAEIQHAQFQENLFLWGKSVGCFENQTHSGGKIQPELWSPCFCLLK